MNKKFSPIELKGLQTYSLSDRKSKVSTDEFAAVWQPGGRFADFLDSFPGILAGNDVREVIQAVAGAHKKNRTVLLGMGAHVIKVGLGPIVIDLLEKEIVSAVAVNGAAIIHEFELALNGRTSEDVAASLGDGSFGMAKETGEFVGRAVALAEKNELGLGEAAGRLINEDRLPHRNQSILAAAERLGCPATVHVAFGTDIVHMHPSFDPCAAGAATHRDFRLFASVVADLEEGVYINLGSAVILPEVFLKATTLTRNLGFPLKSITTVNMDFNRHYRPLTNVVNRPTAGGGRGINLVGHHEIMLPLIAAGILEELASSPIS